MKMKTKHLSRESEFVFYYLLFFCTSSKNLNNCYFSGSKCVQLDRCLCAFSFLFSVLSSSKLRISSKSIQEKMERLAQAAQV